MNRRSLLALCASGLAGAAGCLSTASDPGSGPSDGEPTDGSPASPGESPTDRSPVDGVVLEDRGVLKAVTYEALMGSGGVRTAPDRQYVVASVRADRRVDAEAFAFETDANSWEPGLGDPSRPAYAVAGREGGLVGSAGSDGRSGYLVFALPSPLEASNPRIRLRGADRTWPLSAADRDRLAASAPSFDLVDLSVPDAVAQGDELSVSLTVRNASDVDGRFLAAVYWPTRLIADDDESHVVERRVAADEEATTTLSLDTEYVTSEPEPVPLSVEGHVDAERTVRIEDASSPF